MHTKKNNELLMQAFTVIKKYSFFKTEKWHLNKVNEYCENEIYIKDNRVILSFGADNDSKVIKRSFTYDSPVFDVILLILVI